MTGENEALVGAVEKALASQVTGLSPVAGGDINQAFQLTLRDQRRVFVKTHREAPFGLFAAEARGLAWLAGPHGLRLPHVLASREAEGEAPAFLALEWIARARATPDHAERLGRGLAALHRQGAANFGGTDNNFIGRLPQINQVQLPESGWAAFYREARLRPQLEMAKHLGRASEAMERGFARLFERLETLVGEPEEGPSRLHGDLWSGNAMQDERGLPCLVDPAAYGGDREMDLAMMRLFGGFDSRVLDAYAEAYPLRDGHQDRLPICQLYPLMVHVNLFGGPYISQVQTTLDRF